MLWGNPEAINQRASDARPIAPLSPKALRSIAQPGYLNVWEGAVRSTKTVTSEHAWIRYVSRSPESTFIMSGKTQGSLFRNVIDGEFGILALLGSNGDYHVDREGNRILTINSTRGVKNCYCFGANDDGSYKALRGFSPAGWYADEVNMHARSFVEEAFRRTIVSRDRQHFWTLNPDNPNNYIYTDFLDPYEKKKLSGFHLWKFFLDDNLSLTAERKAELASQYTGVFYRRYILGERCVAEGVIYDMITDENYYQNYANAKYDVRPAGLEYLCRRYIGIDHGVNHPLGMLDVFDDGVTLWVEREYYWDSNADGHQRKTDEEYVDDYLRFAGDDPQFAPMVIVDPEAAGFVEALKRRDVFLKLADKDVSPGISHVSTLFKQRRIKINFDACPNLRRELSGYAWDERAALHGEEKPIKIHDDLADPLRYVVHTMVPSWRYGLVA